MIRKAFLLIFISLLFTGFSLAEVTESSASKEREEGYILLENVILTFRELAVHGAGGVENVDAALRKLMEDATKANKEGKLDPVFFRRYNRILMVLKLVIVEDKTGILGSLVGQEVGRFVEDVKGVRGKLTGGEGISNVADAVTEEIVNLHLYLESKERKEKLRKEIEAKYYPDLKK